MSLILTFSLAKMIGFVGVATGNMKAKFIESTKGKRK